MKDITLDQVKQFEELFLKRVEAADVLETLRKGVINDEIGEKLEAIAAQIISQMKDN